MNEIVFLDDDDVGTDNWFLMSVVPDMVVRSPKNAGKALLDRCLPEFQMEASYRITINAPAERVYQEMRRTSLNESRVTRFLLYLRELPGRLFGDKTDFVRDDFTANSGPESKSPFSNLGSRENEEIVFGIIGRFWNLLRTDTRKVRDLDEFLAFREPGYARAAMNFQIQSQEKGVLLSTCTRVYLPDQDSLIRFRFYWFFIAPFSGVIRIILLRRIKKKSED